MDAARLKRFRISHLWLIQRMQGISRRKGGTIGQHCARLDVRWGGIPAEMRMMPSLLMVFLFS
ncbi:hypothetical protein CA54_20070 [Symmachiella macrocystis]|uniref:Uncharacterized protein n=1 Tax=Symmachiella macrocystis TaxID=2527985 RepID=A0A5C6BP60_9PLAN|nr:hypothetical protein CA54_20070 [Symmachiella macrocystis]